MVQIIFRKKSIFFATFTLLSTVVLLYLLVKKLFILLSPDLYFLYWRYFENVSCYYEKGGVLPVIDSDFSPGVNSIYFHETSCKGDLDSREACAVEAAARAHPQWEVYALIVSPVKNSKSIIALKSFKNVHLYRIDLFEYSKGTPLESMTLSGALNRTRWRILHTSDFLRYLTLFKFGGIYLDLDTIVVKNLEPLGLNWAARESEEVMAAGALAFSRDGIGRSMAEAAIRDLKKNWRGDRRHQNGPEVIYRVLSQVCGTKYVVNMRPESCKGFIVYPEEVVYPVPWIQKTNYLKPQMKNYTNTYIHHIWSSLRNSRIQNNTLYYNLASQYCPTVFKAFGDEF